MAHLLEQNQLDSNYSVDSCGTHGYHSGEKADPRMRRIATGRGYQLTSIAREINVPLDFSEADYIVGMDDTHIKKLRAWDKHAQYSDKISAMTSYCRQQRADDVPDPYYGDDADFELVLDILEDACQGLLDKLQADLQHSRQ